MNARKRLICNKCGFSDVYNTGTGKLTSIKYLYFCPKCNKILSRAKEIEVCGKCGAQVISWNEESCPRCKAKDIKIKHVGVWD